MSTARNEIDILQDQRAAAEAYVALAKDGNSTQAQLREASEAVKALSRELDEYVSKGAKACTGQRLNSQGKLAPCGAHPMGMLKTPAYEDTAKGVEMPNIWEVGCVFCPPFLVEREDGKALLIEGEVKKVKRCSFSARATSPEDAVKNWNSGKWVEDFQLERIPGFTPEYAAES